MYFFLLFDCCSLLYFLFEIILSNKPIFFTPFSPNLIQRFVHFINKRKKNVLLVLICKTRRILLKRMTVSIEKMIFTHFQDYLRHFYSSKGRRAPQLETPRPRKQRGLTCFFFLHKGQSVCLSLIRGYYMPDSYRGHNGVKY